MPKNVIITGCSTGIGKQLALEFHKKGCEVIATARRPESMNELKELGIETIKLDINDKANIKEAADYLLNKVGKIDILVNNAGYAEMGPLIELPDEALEKQFRTNVTSQIVITKAFLLLMKHGNSVIANIGSVSGDFATPFAGAYCASKAAINSLSDALRMELKPFGINVVCVRPGAIESEFGNTAHKQVSKWLSDHSMYSKIEKAIYDRTKASQDNPTPLKVFASKLVRELLKKNPKPVIRLGRGGIALNILGKYIPRKITDKVLSKKFKLEQL